MNVKPRLPASRGFSFCPLHAHSVFLASITKMRAGKISAAKGAENFSYKVISTFLLFLAAFFTTVIVQARFRYFLKGTEYGRSEKSTEWQRVLVL